MRKQFRLYDENSNSIILDEEYLFAFTKYDGFLERGLNAELLIDYDYNSILYVKCNIPTAKKYVFVDYEETILEKALPEIVSLLEILLGSDYLTLKHDYWYETISITDISGQQILINFNSPTSNIHIVDGLPESYFKTISEKHLYRLNDYLKKWIEDKYDNIIRR